VGGEAMGVGVKGRNLEQGRSIWTARRRGWGSCLHLSNRTSLTGFHSIVIMLTLGILPCLVGFFCFLPVLDIYIP
jgi:hypothetical protein